MYGNSQYSMFSKLFEDAIHFISLEMKNVGVYGKKCANHNKILHIEVKTKHMEINIEKF